MNTHDCFELEVWDPLLRCLHWWNATMLLVQLSTGTLFILGEDRTAGDGPGTLEQIHAFAGYAFAAGLMTRVLWLFIGPDTATWRDMLPISSRQRQLAVATLRSYAGVLRQRAPTWFGHNPLAAFAYLALFLVAATQVGLGVTLLNMPAADRETTTVLDFHEIGYFLLMGYVVLHLSAVIVHQFIERRPLVQAMITGRKRFTGEELQAIEGLPGFHQQAVTGGENRER